MKEQIATVKPPDILDAMSSVAVRSFAKRALQRAAKELVQGALNNLPDASVKALATAEIRIFDLQKQLRDAEREVASEAAKCLFPPKY